jgi:cytidylate kinase
MTNYTTDRSSEPEPTVDSPWASIIAIDGPAASGKSTVGYLLARRLNYLYFDTGVMYRAVTLAALQQHVDLQDQKAVGELARRLRIEVRAPSPTQEDGRQATVLLDGTDVTWAIRATEVDQNVSVVAANPQVRTALSTQQRRIGHQYGSGLGDKPGVVMVGRDIGTIVLPDAPLKIFLDAPVEERARRRHSELLARGKDVPFEQVLADMRRRDRLDSERAVAPLRVADDAIVLDTTGLSIDEVVDRIYALAVTPPSGQ